MYARLVTLSLEPGNRSTAEELADKAGAVMRTLSGCEHLSFFRDEDTGRYGSFSLWRTKEGQRFLHVKRFSPRAIHPTPAPFLSNRSTNNLHHGSWKRQGAKSPLVGTVMEAEGTKIITATEFILLADFLHNSDPFFQMPVFFKQGFGHNVHFVGGL